MIKNNLGLQIPKFDLFQNNLIIFNINKLIIFTLALQIQIFEKPIPESLLSH